MRILTKAPQALLVPAFLGAGTQKLVGTDKMVEDFEEYGYPQWFRVFTGAVEITGAAGLLAGFFWPRVTPPAALLLSATMAGALATHVRLGDPVKNMAPPSMLLALSATVLAGRIRVRLGEQDSEQNSGSGQK